MEFLCSSSAFAGRETGMTSLTCSLLIPKADTYFWKRFFFFLHHLISACFLDQVERALITLQPQLWDYIFNVPDLQWEKFWGQPTSPSGSVRFSWKRFSASVRQAEITRRRTEVVLVVALFSQTRNCFCQPEVNPCHSPSCRSLGVVFLQKPKPKFLTK